MEFFEKLTKKKSRHIAASDFSLNTLRFTRLLENTRGILALIEDGREKACGEYILDAHYVAALVEELMEVLGAHINDACMLNPKDGGALYLAYDAHGKQQTELLHALEKISRSTSDSSDGEDPEYRLLKKVMTWFSPGFTGVGSGLSDLMFSAFHHAMQNPCTFTNSNIPSSILDISAPGREQRINVVNIWADDLPPQTVSMDTIRCRPLRLIHMGSSQNAPKENRLILPESGSMTWSAAIDGQQVTLRLDDGVRNLLLVQSTLNGDERNDYIFIYGDNRIHPERFLPDGFHIEKTDDEHLAWKYNISAKDMEESLILLGTRLFSGT